MHCRVRAGGLRVTVPPVSVYVVSLGDAADTGTCVHIHISGRIMGGVVCVSSAQAGFCVLVQTSGVRDGSPRRCMLQRPPLMH